MLTKTSKNLVNEPSSSIEHVIDEIPGETYLELDESKLDVEIVDESQLSQDINGDIILDKVVDEETDFTKLDKIYNYNDKNGSSFGVCLFLFIQFQIVLLFNKLCHNGTSYFCTMYLSPGMNIWNFCVESIM